MTVNDYSVLAQELSKIVNGNLVGFFIMAVVLVVMATTIRTLWNEFRVRMTHCEEQHDACVKQHNECLKRNAVMADALIDLAEGRGYEAKARAETVRYFAEESEKEAATLSKKQAAGRVLFQLIKDKPKP